MPRFLTSGEMKHQSEVSVTPASPTYSKLFREIGELRRRREMPGLDLLDHSPNHPSPTTPLSNASNLILIDNYDSFTWNVYQYLVLEGATVTVFRNDKITLAELIERHPTQLVVSPGPGHPDTDAGISTDAIRHFSGKIPVLGVCMGE